MMYEDVETPRTPRPRRQYPSGELLSLDLLPTLRRGTSETGNFGDQAHRSPSQRQIGNTTLITAMDPMTVSSTRGTTARFRNAANRNGRLIAIAGPRDHPKASRDDGRGVKRLVHDDDPIWSQRHQTS
jgi:hypothetical protein